MNPNKIIGIAVIALAPVIMTAELVRNTKKAVVIKIDEVQCELHNRRHFDKKHDFVRNAKKNKK
jgi:hypothetical protein